MDVQVSRRQQGFHVPTQPDPVVLAPDGGQDLRIRALDTDFQLEPSLRYGLQQSENPRGQDVRLDFKMKGGLRIQSRQVLQDRQIMVLV